MKEKIRKCQFILSTKSTNWLTYVFQDVLEGGRRSLDVPCDELEACREYECGQECRAGPSDGLKYQQRLLHHSWHVLSYTLSGTGLT